MAKIRVIYPDGTEKDVDATIGLSVMEICQTQDIEQIEGACGGSLACATCHLYVHPDWWEKALQDEDDVTMEEEDMLDLAFDIRDKSRLSCQIMMSEELDGMVVALPGAKVDWAA